MPQILSENEWLIAVDKPAGLIVHSDGRTEEPTLAEWLIATFPYLKNVGTPWVSPQGVAYPIGGTVHRLDRTTSGVVLVAKNADAFTYLRGEFKARRVKKIYRAHVHGILEGEGKIVAAIERTKIPPKKWYAHPCDEGDIRAAITAWRSLGVRHDSRADTSYIEAEPLTGRTHQIRVHLSSIGHPLVGEHIYDDQSRAISFPRPALHAYAISVRLPDGTLASFTAPEPADFASLR
jgi:23S rRNA pseudouridine1911/1915/1917 synthase